MTELRRRQKKARHLLDWYLKGCPICDRDRYNVKEELPSIDDLDALEPY